MIDESNRKKKERKNMFTILELHWGYWAAIFLAGATSYCIYLAGKESAENRLQRVKDHIDSTETNVIDAMKAQYDTLPEEIKSKFVESLDLTKGQIVIQINKKNESSKKEIVQIFQGESKEIRESLNEIKGKNNDIVKGIETSNVIQKNRIVKKPIENLYDFVLNDYFSIAQEMDAKNIEYQVIKGGKKKGYNPKENNTLNEMFKLRDKFSSEIGKLETLLKPFKGEKIYRLGVVHINQSKEFCNHYKNASAFLKGSYSYEKMSIWRNSDKIFSNELSNLYMNYTKSMDK